MKSLSLSKPHLIIMVGLPGSGKTFFAEKFAETFHAPLVSREKVTQKLGHHDATDEILSDQLVELTKTGQSIVVDGMANTRVMRNDLMKLAKHAGYATLIVWVQTDPATAKSRALRTGQSDQRQLRDADDFDAASRHFSPPVAAEKPVVISGKHTYATQAKVVLKRLSEPRATISLHTKPPVRPVEPGRRNSITIR